MTNICDEMARIINDAKFTNMLADDIADAILAMPQIKALVDAAANALEAAENFPDLHDGRVGWVQMLDHLHQWEAEHLQFGKIKGLDDALAPFTAAKGALDGRR